VGGQQVFQNFFLFFFVFALDMATWTWYNEATPPWGGGGVAHAVPTLY